MFSKFIIKLYIYYEIYSKYVTLLVDTKNCVPCRGLRDSTECILIKKLHQDFLSIFTAI